MVMGSKEKLTSHNDAITTGLEDNEAVLSYLDGGVLEQQGTWDAPDGSELNGRWDREWILSAYLDLTDAMIQHLGGYENEQPDFVPDEVLFLDKSARPVAWLVDSLWEVMADKGAKKPHLDFIHIDRKDWWSRVKLPLVGEENRDPFEFKIEDVSEDVINAIRAKFVIGDLTPDNYGNEVWKLPTTLDGKNVLIVDEIRSSGATTYMARNYYLVQCQALRLRVYIFGLHPIMRENLWRLTTKMVQDQYNAGCIIHRYGMTNTSRMGGRCQTPLRV